LLTPKKSIQLQFDLGTDLMVCFDDVPPHDIGKKGMSSSIKHTIAWAKICKKEFENQIKKRKLGAKRPLLFAVIQGGSNIELRKKCFEALCQVGFSAKGGPASGWDGFGFGARPVDSEGNFLEDVLDYTARLIPDDKIRFNLGMGTPSDIVRSVKMGWDLFDCVIPTREARHGRLYLLRHPEQASPAKRGKAESTRHKLREGSRESRAASNRRDPSLPQRVHWVVQDDVSINITNSKFSTDLTPINQSSKLPELREYTKAYLHHLFKTAEPLSIRLATLNNVEFYMGLMSDIRMAISKNEI
jgi:queuine tRNA-ribosyltransferase